MELDTYTANSNEGTKTPGQRYKPCLQTMRQGERESPILTGGGEEVGREKPADRLH